MFERKRIKVRLPKEMREALNKASEEHQTEPSFIIQRAVTKMSEKKPTEMSIKPKYRGNEDNIPVLVVFPDTVFRLLCMWSEYTGLSKSMLVRYSLQETILKEVKTEKENF